MEYFNIRDLVGKTFDEVVNVNDEEIQFRSKEGPSYHMYHSQDCCESVSVEDICGDLSDLAGTPIITASEEVSSNENPEGSPTPEWRNESWTWTFYRISTIKGTVVIRWYGSSNGYYSESVSVGVLDFSKKVHAQTGIEREMAEQVELEELERLYGKE